MSEIWNYFKKNDTNTQVSCTLCNHKLKYSSSTSTLWHHVKTKHINTLNASDLDVSECSTSSIEAYCKER